MKNKLLTLLAVLAIGCTLIHAQSTNSFIVTPSTNVTVAPAVPAVTASSTAPLTVRMIVIDAVNQKMTIYFIGVSAPVVIQGAAFTAFQSQFQGTFAAAIAAYLASQSH